MTHKFKQGEFHPTRCKNFIPATELFGKNGACQTKKTVAATDPRFVLPAVCRLVCPDLNESRASEFEGFDAWHMYIVFL